MNTILVPQTTSGRWAAAFGVLFFALLIVQLAEILTVPGFALAVVGVLAMGIAIFAIARRHERSLWAFLAVAAGLLVIILVFANLFAAR